MKLILKGDPGKKFVGFLFESEVVYVVSEDQDIADLLSISREDYLKRVKAFCNKAYERGNDGLYLDLKNSEVKDFLNDFKHEFAAELTTAYMLNEEGV